jgi:hypothetical protein
LIPNDVPAVGVALGDEDNRYDENNDNDCNDDNHHVYGEHLFQEETNNQQDDACYHERVIHQTILKTHKMYHSVLQNILLLGFYHPALQSLIR